MRAEKAKKRKADRKGGRTQGNENRKRYGNPRVGKSGWKGSSAVAGKPASSSSASHKGYGGYKGSKQYSRPFCGDQWEDYPSAWYDDPPNQVWYNRTKNETWYHWGYDPSNPYHQAFPKRDAYASTRPAFIPPSPWADMGGPNAHEQQHPWANFGGARSSYR